MADQTTLLNDALGQLGQSRITSIDDASHQAQLCKTFYDTLRRSLLRDHKWNFATSWLELAQDVATPPAKWAYQYTVPPNVLRIWGIDEDGKTPFEVMRGGDEIKKLMTNEATAIAEATFDLTNPDQWDGSFYQAFATLMASKLAPGIIGGDTGLKVSDAKLEQGQSLLLDAKAIDGQENSIEILQSTALTTDVRGTTGYVKAV